MQTRPADRPLPTGSTADAGWELGVRRTVPDSPDEIWQSLLADWLPAWLEVDSVPKMVGAPLRRGAQVCGRVVGCHVGRRVRLRWHPPHLDHETVFQVTLLEAASGCTIAIHQERLRGSAERQELLERWTDVLERLREARTAAAPARPDRDAEG